MSTEQYPINQGGHRIRPYAHSRGKDKEWACDDCEVIGTFSLFNVIGQRDFCPARVESMNGYIWFNADDASVARTRAAHQWSSYAARCGFAIEDWTYDPDTPGVCATFTWHEQAYVLRFGADAERGMKANDLRVELADQKPEQTVA